MFEEGVVKSVSANKIEFQPTLTSCSGTAILHVVPTDFELYYSRTGGTLKLDTKPIQTKVHNSLGEAVGSIFVDMIGQSLQSLLQSAFTFGSARSFLTSGSGTFILDAKPSAQRLGEKAAVVGCFSTIGSGFDKSAHPPTW